MARVSTKVADQKRHTPPPPPPVDGPAPDYTDFRSLVKSKFAEKVRQSAALAYKIKQLDEEKRKIQAELSVLLKNEDVKTVKVDEIRVTLVESSNSHLDKQKLIAAGVPVGVIQAATVVKPYTYVKITEPKEQ